MTYLFPPPPGSLHAKAVSLLRQQILSLSTTVFPEEQHGYGVLGAILTLQEWMLLPNVDLGDPQVDYSFQPPPRPPPFPNAAGAQAAWKRQEKLFVSYSAGLQTIKAFILDSVDPLLLRTIDPRNVAYLSSPAELLALLDARYLTMNPADIAQARLSLSIPYMPPQLIRVYISEQIELHNLLATNNAIVNGVDQFQALLVGVTKCGLFRDPIAHFMNGHPTSILQTFDSLSVALIAAADNLSPSMTTKAMALSATEDNVALLVTQLDDKFQLSGKQPSDPKQRVGTYGIITQHFCDQHGWCNKLHTNCAAKSTKKKG
jgi:hypothetical protein